METVGSPALVAGFTALVLGLLALDLGVFHRSAHTVSMKEALAWTAVWVALALSFTGVIWQIAPEADRMARVTEFVTGYVVEYALSVDNLFVFVMVFSFFKVPALYQHRVLFWGIMGALVMRGVFIMLGAALIHQFEWIIYVFGAFLIYTGYKMFTSEEDDEGSLGENRIVKTFRKLVPMSDHYHGARFFVVENGRKVATPLLLVLVVIEFTDVIFAVDSVPAIFGVTKDPFIVYTSNVFAILGLRSLYFLLAGGVTMLRFLKPAVSLVLIFVGAKMVGHDYLHHLLGNWMTPLSLLVIVALLAGGVVLSFAFPEKEHAEKEHG